MGRGRRDADDVTRATGRGRREADEWRGRRDADDGTRTTGADDGTRWYMDEIYFFIVLFHNDVIWNYYFLFQVQTWQRNNVIYLKRQRKID